MASKKTDRTAKTREAMFPELKLPFVKFVGGSPGTTQIDYWSPPNEKIDGLDGNFRGEMYALATVRHMSDHLEQHPVLGYIVEAMLKKGSLYGKKPDYVVQGFIGALEAILINADRSGVVNGWVRASAAQLAKHAECQSHGTCVRESVKRSVAEKEAWLHTWRKLDAQREIRDI